MFDLTSYLSDAQATRLADAAAARDDAVLASTFPEKWTEMAQAFGLPSGSKVWVVEGGWITGFAEMLRTRYPQLPILDVHRFGRYLEIFDLPVSSANNGTR